MPGQQYESRPLFLDMAFGWRSEIGGFEIKPGRHTVRAALARGLSEDGKMVSVRAVSNPVEIEILPAEAKNVVQVEVRPGKLSAVTDLPNNQEEPQGNADEVKYEGRTIAELIAALGDQDSGTRISAVYHLGNMGPEAKSAVPSLVDALNQKGLRESILHSLGNIGAGAEEAIPALIKAIAEYAPACRWKAAEALAKIGEPAVAALKKASESDDMNLRIWCNAALAKQQETDSPHLRYLGQLMKSADEHTASEAVRALTMLGPLSKLLVPDFIEALNHSAVPRKNIAFALAQIGKDAKRAMPELLQMLQDADLWTQGDAVYAIFKIGGSDAAPAVPLLIESLKTKNTSNVVAAARVRYRAAAALENIGWDARPAIPDLVIALDDEHEFVRASSAAAIGSIDPTNPQSAPALVKAMSDQSGRVRSSAAQSLAKVGPLNKEVILAFIKAADDNWKGVRYASDRFFTYLGPEHSYIVPDLIEMLKSPEEGAQHLGATALGNMGRAAVSAVPDLAKSMRNPRLESVASRALGRLGPEAGAAVPDLIQMLKVKRSRFSAAFALEAIGPAARQAIPALEDCLGQWPQTTFARALLAIDPKSAGASAELVRIAESPYVPNQWTEQPDAHYLLVKYGHDKDRHLQALIDALENTNSRIRLKAAAYLGRLGAEANRAVDSLRGSLRDDDPEVRVEAARAILTLAPGPSLRKEAVDVILGSLDGTETMTQVRAAGALKGFGAEEAWAVAALIVQINARSSHTRLAAIETLGNIGPAANQALPDLKRLLRTEAWAVRQATARAIKQIEEAEKGKSATPAAPM